MSTGTKKLLIATPAFGGNVTTDYLGSLLNTLRWAQEQKISVEVYLLKNESLISRARNNCASYALRGEHDKLLFIDADQVWTADDVARLWRSERTLVGGTYSKKTLPWDLNFTPLDSHRDIFPGGAKSAERFREYAKLADSAGEIEVRHLATGFMLIDISVIRDLCEKAPSYLARDNQHSEETRHWDIFPSGVINGGYESEDFFFCSIAYEAGHPAYLNVDTLVGHIGALNYAIPKSLRLEPRK